MRYYWKIIKRNDSVQDELAKNLLWLELEIP